MNDMSTGGGLNNEGLQVTVTNEPVESDKDIIQEVLDDIFDELGIFDYKVKLFPSEEEDLVWKEDLFSKQLDNAEKFLAMNGEVSFKDGEFQYKETSLEKSTPEFSSFGSEEQKSEQKKMPTNPTENVKKEYDKDDKGFEFMSSSDFAKPFAGYKNFKACVLENKDKVNPEAYCAEIMRRTEKEHNEEVVMKKLKKPKTFPKKTATEEIMKEFEKEYNSMIKQAINKITKE